MKTSEEQQFENKVENTPIIQEIIADLNGLKAGQERMEQSLGSKIDNLANVIKEDKEQDLKDKIAKLNGQLTRNRTNMDKVKNGVITGLILLIATVLVDVFVTNKFLNKPSDSNTSLDKIEKAITD